MNTEALAIGSETFSKHEFNHVTAKSMALFHAWTKAFQPILETHDILEVESEFVFPLLNPETGSASRTFVEAGKIDGIMRHRASGMIKNLEHKTTSDSIEPESDYWARLIMDFQSSKYILSGRAKGLDISSSIYDVIRKPASRPKAIPLIDPDGFKIVHDSTGTRVWTKDGKKPRESGDTAMGYVLQTREETPQEYYARILEEMEGKQSEYFAQKEIPRSDDALLEYMKDAWSQSQMILHFKSKDLWPRNPSACTAFGTCEYFDLCAGRATVDGIRYATREKKHAELAGVETDKEFLTNSRLSTLSQCGRKHYLRYENPTERIGESDEALRIGTLFHEAAEAYLKLFIVK